MAAGVKSVETYLFFAFMVVLLVLCIRDTKKQNQATSELEQQNRNLASEIYRPPGKEQ